LGLADAAEPQRLDPGEAVEGEAVVQFGHVDVGGAQVGAGPQVGGLAGGLGVGGGRGRGPLPALGGLGGVGRGAAGGAGEVGCGVDGGDDDGHGSVAGDVAVVEAEGGGDGAGLEVVVHRHRVAVDGGGVEGGVGALVEGDPAEGLAGGAVTVHVALGVLG